jgi:hypothetical protein
MSPLLAFGYPFDQMHNGFLFGTPKMKERTVTAKSRRNWKRIQPISLRHAMVLCKEHGQERLNLSIERIAELMGLADHWSLYKWIENGRMPAVLIPAYENACGIDFITRWLAASRGRLLIDIPTGRALTDVDVVALQTGFGAAMQLLTDFHSGKADAGATLDALTAHIEQVAFHHANVTKYAAPEFAF